MASNLPYAAEYAKSGRASCKKCKDAISKDSLRMSVRTQSAFFDGMQDNWFHFKCFWTKIKGTVVEEEIRGLENLKWDDQERIRKNIEEASGSVNEDTSASNAASYKVEKAKSAKGKCKTCQASIAKGDLKFGIKSVWYCLGCAKQRVSAVDESVAGFADLDDDLQLVFREAFPPPPKPTKTASKRKGDSSQNGTSSDAGDAKKSKSALSAEAKHKAAQKAQSEAFWKLRSELKLNVHKSDWKGLLETNQQELPSGGDDKLLDRLTDCLLFGALEKCPECKTGQLVYSTSNRTYRCLGHSSAWAKCEYQDRHPKRVDFVIDEGFKENEYLANFKFTPGRERVYAETTTPAANGDTNGHSTTTTTKSSVHPFAQRSAKMLASSSGKSWGGKSGKSVSRGSQKMTVKGGGAVDPECDEAVAVKSHIYKDKKGVLWNSVLGNANIQTNSNSYYKLQLLEGDAKMKYYLFRSWGRVGTDIGGTKLEKFNSDLESAKTLFRELFAEKSGNEWQDSFEKKPGKMYPIQVDYGQDDDVSAKSAKDAPVSASTLPKPIQSLIQMIFDINQMKQTMKEFEIDMQKMPLGKLSKTQMKEAYFVLSQLLELLKKGKDNALRPKIVEATNRFYTLIPHDFGTAPMKLLDNEAIIKEKSDMLESLLEIEVAYSILQNDADDGGKAEDPIDKHYRKLNTHMEVLDKESDEFQRLVQYAENTHAATHTSYKLEIEEVFKVQRDGELERFTAGHFDELQNRMLLWHGSRTSNYAGILSQGLRIAPPEAPVTGYMFGKGVYFADMVSKSANYCFTNKKNNEGLMMLCEVALGDMFEAKQSTQAKLPKGKHSLKGVGRTIPDPSGNFVTEDGVTIPMGRGVDSKINDSSLLYNEYIVYDVAQINIKYLLKMNFKYK